MTSWRVLAPVAEPVKHVNPAADFVETPDGVESGPSRRRQWEEHDARAGYVDFEKRFGETVLLAGYAACWAHVGEPRQAAIEVGGDDEITVWVNRDPVLADADKGFVLPGEQPVAISLRAGWNEILVAVKGNEEGWGFYLEVLDHLGRGVLQGLEVRAVPPSGSE